MRSISKLFVCFALGLSLLGCTPSITPEQKAQQQRAAAQAAQNFEQGWARVQVGMTQEQVCELIYFGMLCSLNMRYGMKANPALDGKFVQDGHILVFQGNILKAKQW